MPSLAYNVDKSPKELKPHKINEEIYGIEGPDSDLIESIKERGILEPIVIREDNVIISGHRRWIASKELQLDRVPCRIIYFNDELDEEESLIEFNRQRVKNFSQKLKESEYLTKIESERAKRRFGGHHKDNATPPTLAELKKEEGETRDIVADKIGMSHGTFDKAKKIWEEAKKGNEKAQEQIKALDQGTTTINSAFGAIKKEQKIQEIKNEVNEPGEIKGNYRVVYADPPWQYGNSMNTTYGTADKHYTTMSLDQICAMPIQEITANDAVLFLWATSPQLPEALKVMAAWGFVYKASFIWDKIKHVMGHYNSVRHEFLLVGVRGSYLPEQMKLFDSVVSEERTDHSEKPETFRGYINVLYPSGKRIELFARKKTEGWDTYGNQL